MAYSKLVAKPVDWYGEFFSKVLKHFKTNQVPFLTYMRHTKFELSFYIDAVLIHFRDKLISRQLKSTVKTIQTFANLYLRVNFRHDFVNSISHKNYWYIVIHGHLHLLSWNLTRPSQTNFWLLRILSINICIFFFNNTSQ